MCMLRDDPKVVELGCDPDFRYRHVCAQLQDMRIKADLEYACSVDLSVTSSLEYPACLDARYLYDAEHIVEAYRNLWDENTKPVAQLLAEIEDNGVYEVEDIWKDPLYLHDLAISLMGPSLRVFSRKASDCVIEPCSRMVSKNLTARHAM